LKEFKDYTSQLWKNKTENEHIFALTVVLISSYQCVLISKTRFSLLELQRRRLKNLAVVVPHRRRYWSLRNAKNARKRKKKVHQEKKKNVNSSKQIRNRWEAGESQKSECDYSAKNYMLLSAKIIWMERIRDRNIAKNNSVLITHTYLHYLFIRQFLFKIPKHFTMTNYLYFLQFSTVWFKLA